MSSPNDETRLRLAYALPNTGEVERAAARSFSAAWRRSADVVLFSESGIDRKVLLIRRSRAPFAEHYAFPGGHAEGSEPPSVTAVRELKEETGLTVSLDSLVWVGEYGDAQRDPRLVVSNVFASIVADRDAPVAGDDAADATWVLLSSIATGEVVLAFDHARVLWDALVKLEISVPGDVKDAFAEIARLSDERNAALLLAVNKMLDRSAEFGQQVLLTEYQALKAESTERIKQRDSFINLNLIAIAAIISFSIEPSRLFALLAVPWVAMSFGWSYLANDEKVSALAKYTRYWLGPRLGDEFFAWERSAKRSTNIRRTHKWVQLIADLFLFVLPAVVAPVIFLQATRQDSPSTFWLILAASEIMLAIGLGVLFVVHSHVVSRWDVRPDDWRRL